MSNVITCWLTTDLTASRDGNRSCMYPAGSTANEKRAIRQQADMFVLKERLLYYRATDAVGEISLMQTGHCQ